MTLRQRIVCMACSMGSFAASVVLMLAPLPRWLVMLSSMTLYLLGFAMVALAIFAGPRDG